MRLKKYKKDEMMMGCMRENRLLMEVKKYNANANERERDQDEVDAVRDLSSYDIDTDRNVRTRVVILRRYPAMTVVA